MFLKRLELAGFKSFADRTELEFVSGITAVVGPNGSGKSNISDSIRWVLGEQSAKSLRGGNMQDIIFAGSDARKAVNFSEVSLTLDNGDNALSLDFSEVTVTRRLHRNGESEYFINKQPCRLKDITELFMDTGIGKEAYSIIGQGRIEEILSTRSEDRRGIFEEASGIVKYKSRKREASKRLEETEANLVRIRDLTSELEDQLEPLKKQSEKAVEFKRLKELLKSKEVSLYVHSIGELHRSWTEATETLKRLKDEELKLAAVVSAHDAELEDRRLALRKLDETLEGLQSELLHTSEELEKTISAGEILKERRKHAEENVETQRDTAKSLARKLEERVAENEQLRTQRDAITRELDELNRNIRLEEDRLLAETGGALGETEERLKAELLDKLNELASARNELKYVEAQSEQSGRRAARLAEDREKAGVRLRELEACREDWLARLESLKAQIEGERNRYMELSQLIHEKQGLLEEVQATVRKWEQKVDALVSRKQTIQDLQDDYDGFALGVREVLKAKQKSSLQGIRGAVAEIIRVPGAYELAVETSLGAALQHIVVENEARAREAIQYLKSRQLGRATFLPLDVIKPRSIPESERRAASSAEGFVGVAAELVSFDAAYSGIVHSLLGNVVIADTLEHANRIAAKLQYRYRVVTLEGDVVNAGGSMTGGSLQKKNVSLLGRTRQIDELTKEIEAAEQQIGKLRESVDAVRAEAAALQKQLEGCRDAGERKRGEETEARSELNRMDSELRAAKQQLDILEADAATLAEETSTEADRRAELAERIERLAGEETALTEAIREAELRRKAAQSAKEETQQQLTEWKVKAAAAAQDKMAVTAQLTRLQTETDALEEERATALQAEARLLEELAGYERESNARTEQANHLRILKDACAEKLDFARAERAEKTAALEREENATREERNRLRSVEEQTRQTDIRVNRLDVELDNLLRKLAEDYELSYELAKERYDVPEDVPAVQIEVRDLKRAISALGEVNLGAIEEYARVSERYEFLAGQRNDLIEAKTTLYGVIREIEEEMSKRFLQSFELIREQFTDVFSRLFGGGRADLVLSEPHNLLETGIDIVAQPPGKKLQNLQLLSGGERALTAIALLFAILRIKPVPFCVLDEVEAALDEANVARFAQYLREFSMHTQFIVVTHRKGTMEEADVLYGVTMEEGGVSKLVSVRLDQDEQPMTA
ncbi:chromosome segregation protein SMC [Paenibacillus antri]|uniref:Chromosome partition protein Smc n=1 Tax=Paenibacillus antri TaxID=2582848 RepID=A0A5R9GAX5_9BACL|nr:chromosome segregation protein SMC [Paenibacillus antri]TLS49883.1 chromosome segregation protein SMC [Paenibacillus antri]